MSEIVQQKAFGIRILNLVIIVAVLSGALLLGSRASILVLGLIIVFIGGILLMLTPVLGVIVLVLLALFGRISIGTGSEVSLNPVTVLIPLLAGIWLVSRMAKRDVTIVQSRVNLPLLLFLLAGLLSFFIGYATWDPSVPRSSNMPLVQLAQWSIYVFSAVAFWLTANLIKDEVWLHRLTNVFLIVGGLAAIFYTFPPTSNLTFGLATEALIRPPFWVLLAGLVGGQLLFNDRLKAGRRVYLTVVMAAICVYAFVLQREAVSNWVGVGAVLAVLFWLRFPRFRWIVLLIVIALVISGVLQEAVFQFAGGQEEWQLSGGSRLVLIERVLRSTLRNPITGLGPAAYRAYGATEPLIYRRIVWYQPAISSHNNYVDVFAHFGLVGLALLAWFVFELTRLGIRLREKYKMGFRAAYINGMLATGVGALGLMALADWILPFVYNIGFPGFQASVLIWLFLGGVVAIEIMNP